MLRTVATKLVLFLLLSNVAMAQDNDFAFAGAGTASCDTYLSQASDSMVSAIYLSWAQGFLSGINTADYLIENKALVILPDSETIKAHLDDYCRSNPLEPVFKGVLQLYSQLPVGRS